MPEFDAVQRQALAWVIRLHSGEATSDDAAALALWRKRSAEHEAAFREAVHLWRTFGAATRELIGSEHAAAISLASPRAAVSRRLLLGGALAAAASLGGVYAAVHPPLGLWPSLEELAADYRTGKGERRKIEVAGDIGLTLNTQTSLSLRSTSAAPRIELISGEAALDVARDNAPVVVDAGGGRIAALRARLNIRCIDGEVQVACFAGDVEVAWKDRKVQLTAAQQSTYSDASGLVPASPFDLEQEQAWQRGLLLVHDWPVARLVSEINRYRPGRIVIMDSQLGRRMISGTFNLDHLDDFIAQARGLFGATARTLPGGIVLLS
ncbi:DUF4880 domain-containing protein [Rhodopseudomonas palustris]|nr:iron dicitrate transport regulator FecR [Rhodopseudomonas palustris]RJF60730.1 DUF4880 domain-containing protein [Rhodopseudomonas palustris]CAE26791.1 probable FecR, iron siderophore sensor protein [Rhodopseudomonas palustris CGA009]